MAICSYIVIPAPESIGAVADRLARLPGCAVVPAENRDVLLLVTETATDAEEEALRRALERTDGIQTLMLTFGEIDSPPMQPSSTESPR
jgi:nitrate reductase NapAB chaperone NapD